MPDKLLIVEDTRVFAQMMKSLVLDEHGIESDVVESASQLNSKLTSGSAHRYFAAIVDLELPDAKNGEAIDIVVRAQIPTIVFTGTADEAVEKDLWQKNIADYAHKSSAHSIEHVVWLVKRIFDNPNHQVLIINDPSPARDKMVKLLETQRLEVHTADSEQAAFAKLDECPHTCLVIIDMDSSMNKMNSSISLAAKIRSQFDCRSLEILGVSTPGNSANPARFIKAGADDFLPKPFVPEEFLCHVNRTLDRIDQYKKLVSLNSQKNLFLSTAAHDIRGPLSAIHNAAQLLQKKNWPEERKICMLEMIERNSADMQTLLNELLDFSAIESGQLKLNCAISNFSSIVQERVQLYSASADAKQIAVQLSTQDNLTLSLDRIKIQQVVDNFLSNAIKFSPEGGSIQITLKKDDRKLRLDVSDQGPGIPKAEEKKLFKAYQVLSTKSSAGEKQTGLGLVIAKNIIDAHGGTISYRSASPHGAIFSITLPLINACSTGTVNMAP